jgi:hypothetical protein
MPARRLSALLIIFALAMAAIGLTLIAVPGNERIILFGHHPDSMIPVFGGRYLAMSLMIVALLALRQWLAISVVLAIGAAMGFLDAWLVSRVGISTVPHVVAGAICVALALAARSVAPTAH